MAKAISGVTSRGPCILLSALKVRWPVCFPMKAPEADFEVLQCHFGLIYNAIQWAWACSDMQTSAMLAKNHQLSCNSSCHKQPIHNLNSSSAPISDVTQSKGAVLQILSSVSDYSIVLISNLGLHHTMLVVFRDKSWGLVLFFIQRTIISEVLTCCRIIF